MYLNDEHIGVANIIVIQDIINGKRAKIYFDCFLYTKIKQINIKIQKHKPSRNLNRWHSDIDLNILYKTFLVYFEYYLVINLLI